MTQVQGIPYRRHGPSAALREFLDPLDPGEYFDCGRARLHGIDDALVDEARQRGRPAGDDHFVLVATDLGLIFSRPSISFALVAPWDEVTMIRPRGDGPTVLPVKWPGRGELKFAVSKRLAHNIFRRWLQLRMQANRQAREAVVDLQARRLSTGPVAIVGTGLAGAPDAPWSGPDQSLRNLDAETTSEPMNGPGPVAAVALEAPPACPGAEDGSLLPDGELARVTVPASNHPRSWLALGVGVLSSVVVLSTVVTLVAVSVGLYRRVVGGTGPGSDSQAVEVAGPTTIDHRRFDLDGATVPDLAVGGPGAGNGPGGLAGSSVTVSSSDLPASDGGGTAGSPTPSNQQLLAIGSEAETAWSPTPAGADDGVSAGGAQRCNSNYSGCVPDVTDLPGVDVDCLGAGDGPLFVDGRVTVLGSDVYDLDTDGDGTACEVDQPVTSSD